MKGLGIVLRVLLASSVVAFAASEESPPKGKSNSALVACEGTRKAHNSSSHEWYLAAASSSPLKGQTGIKDRISVTAFGALLINRFSKKDHGEYICRITSGDGVEDVHTNVDDKHRLEKENCHPASCIEAEKCTTPGSKNSCPNEGEVCCGLVRDEDKHHCRHFLGECKEGCAQNLQVSRADDCGGAGVCCVLV